MSYICADCGQEHAELPRYFMRKLPEDAHGKTLHVTSEGKSLCRSADARCLSNVNWNFRSRRAKSVSGSSCGRRRIPPSTSDSRRSGPVRALNRLQNQSRGRLANPITCIDGSWGTHVKFKVLQNDPVPYIKWVAAGSLMDKTLGKR
jgi:hypothetical protein